MGRQKTNEENSAKPGLVGKTLAFAGTFGYRDMSRNRYQEYASGAGATVVDLEKAVPDYLVVGDGRGGKPPAVVAKVTKQHPTIQILDLPAFCLMLLPSAKELVAELRSGPRDHVRWDQLEELFRESKSTLDLRGADLRKTNLFGAKLTAVSLDNADLRKCSAHYAAFGNLYRVRFDGADLSNVYFFDAKECSFGKAKMTKAWLGFGQSKKRYERCDLTGADLNQVRGDDCHFIDCNFTGAKLADAELEKATLSAANLTGADLSRAHCSQGKFDGANLSRAVLFRTDFRNASLQNTDLRQADLREAVLTGADLTGARIEKADFAGAILTGAKLTGLDPASAKNFQPPIVRQPGPKLAALAKAAATSKDFLTSAEVDLGKGEHAQLALRLGISGNRRWIDARSDYQRDGNEAYDRINAPSLEIGIINLAERWPNATLRLDTVKARGCRTPRGQQLVELAMAAWGEAFQLEVKSPEALEQQRSEQKTALAKLRETMLKELKGGQAGVKRWNARPERDHQQLGPLHDLDLKGAKLAGVALKNLDLQGGNFAGASLMKAKLWSCKLQRANFDDANLESVTLNFSECEGASFQHATLTKCQMTIAYFRGANFQGADLRGSDLSYSRFTGADFTRAKLDGVNFKNAHFDANTKFPRGFVLPPNIEWEGPPPGIDISSPTSPGGMDFNTFFQRLGYKTDRSALSKALTMLKADRFQLFAEVKDDALFGVVKSQSDKSLVYSCRLAADGNFACCTQNLKVCGGLHGKLCKHLLVLIVGLTKAARLDPATADQWVAASNAEKPVLKKDLMSETFLRYKGAEAGEVDWRPTETTPEDYYAL
jgi:uncharacterized protein YjbI with pentapeptide repeats